MDREWHALVEHDQDMVFLWAGAWRRGETCLGWSWHWVRTRDENGRGDSQHPAVSASPAAVERMLSPLAHEARIRIMQTMHDGPKSAGQLSDATGLRGGNLYYHLKELLHASYVKEQGGGYDLTPLGCQMLLTVAAIASKVIEDRGEQGLLVADRSRGGPYPRARGAQAP
jgi:DNA-binding transcriptional ArsR family regulator